MSIAKHFLVVFIAASCMTTYLYAYKPRDYATYDLVTNFIINISIWVAIFGVPYLVVALLIKLVRRYLLKC